MKRMALKTLLIPFLITPLLIAVTHARGQDHCPKDQSKDPCADAKVYCLCGKVVIKNSDDPVGQINVVANDAKTGKEITTAFTDGDGKYKLPIRYNRQRELIDIIYSDSRGYPEFGTNANRNVQNDVPNKTLDTMSVANLMAPRNDKIQAKAAAIGAANYVDAGGPPPIAIAVLKFANEHFFNFRTIIQNDKSLVVRFQRLELLDKF